MKASHMTLPTSSDENDLARTETIAIRSVRPDDLPQIARFAFTVSIAEPLTDPDQLARTHAAHGFWQTDSGAVAIVERSTGRLLGTSQFYRSAPCIHGYELGYIIHDPSDRGRGFAAPAVRLFSDLLFAERPAFHRQQLIIEVWNRASWRLAERCGFVREGLLRSAGFGSGDPSDCFLYGRTRKDWHEERHTTMGVG
jgi:RimJ/RimL family protein N-acetyltransferase